MADQNWWEQAPLESSAKDDKWWESAPLADAPAPPKKEAKTSSFAGSAAEGVLDFVKRGIGAAVSGIASIPEGLQSGARAFVRNSTDGDPMTIMPSGAYIPGVDTDESLNGPMTQEQKNRRELNSERMAGAVKIPGSAAAAKWGKEKQQVINDTASQATKDAVANSQITGNLLKGEIDFGKDPSVRGFVMQGADVFGSMLPVVATALATRNPGAGAAVGGSMAAGEGVGNARDFIAKQSDADLMKNSPLYARMIDAGASPEEARNIVTTRAEDTAGVLQGLVASMGDHFTGKLVTGALDPLMAKVAGKSVAGKVAAGTALSSLEEGTQELTEGVASDLGTKSVVGNKEIGEDSAANFVLGAIGGGAPGAARGAVAAVKERRAVSEPVAEGAEPASPVATVAADTTAAPGAPQAEVQQTPVVAADPQAQAGTLSAAPAQLPSGEVQLDPQATQRLAELEVIDSTTGLSPEQKTERAVLAQQIEEQAAKERELEDVGESPELAASVPEQVDQQLAGTATTDGAFDPAAVKAKTFPQFAQERGFQHSALKNGSPEWNQLRSEWDALKTYRAGNNPEGTGSVGAPTPEIQNRDRSRPASVVQMQGMAQAPDYMRLGPSRSPENGAPMVFANGDQVQAAHAIGRGDVAVMSDGQRVPFQYAVMEAADVQPSNFADGGVNPMFDSEHPGVVKALNNGRTAGLRAAYERGTAESYKAELLADSAQHGIDPAVIEGMQAPMLVRLYSQQDNRTNMGAKSQSQALGMSATEQAATDAALVDNSVLDTFDSGALDSAGNRDFARAFIGKLQEQGQDVAGMLDANGGLSPAGVTRLQAALVHKAYGDGDLVESMFGSTDNDIRAIGEALKSVAGEWANMRAAAAAGAINPQADVTGNLLQAIRMVQKARRERASLYDAVQQVDMITGEVPDALTVGMLRLLYSGHYLTRALGRDRVAESLREYLGAALATRAEGDMFGEQVGPDAILSALNTKPTAEKNDASTAITEQPAPSTAQSERAATGGDPAGGRADESGQQEQRPEPDRAGQAAPEDGGRGEGQNAQDPERQSDREGAEGTGEDSRGTVDDPESNPTVVTDTAEFKRWFGDSQVVDADGKPMVMFHGTSADFSAFDQDKGRRGLLGAGFYFTNSPKYASMFAEGDGANVMPVYLKMESPLRADSPQEAVDALRERGVRLHIEEFTEAPVSEVGALLKKAGFDGVIYGDGTHIVTDPAQIKSATGNNGEFDSTDPDIRFSRVAETNKVLAASQGLSSDDVQKLLGVMPKTQASTTFRDGEIQRVQQLVDALKKDWTNAPPIEVVYDMQDERVPAVVQRRESKKSGAGAAEGFYFQGKAYLVASQLPTEKDAARVLFHEVLGHHGLRSVFGKRLDPLLTQIVQVRPQEVAAKLVDYKLENTHENRLIAAEEVLANMAEKTPELGFVRRAVAAIQTWLREHGFMNLQVSDAEIIRDFILPARGWVQRGAEMQNGQPAAVALAMSRSKGGRTFGKENDTVIADFVNDMPLKRHPDYKAAKAGDALAAVRVVTDLVKESSLQQAREQFGDDAIFVPVQAVESKGMNNLPNALAMHYANALGASVSQGIKQSNMAFHTGAGPMERLMQRAEFDGEILPGKRYVLVDDVTTMGSTLADMAAFIQRNGGQVAGSVVMTNAMRGGKIAPLPKTIKQLEAEHGQAIRDILGIDANQLTREEAQYLIGFKSTDEIRTRAARSTHERVARLDAKALPERQVDLTEQRPDANPNDSSGDVPMFSRNGALPSAAKGRLTKLQDKVRDLTGYDSIDSFLYAWQDKFIDLKRIQADVKALNGTVSETNDAYRGEELYHKRVAKRTANFRRDELMPLMRSMNEAKVHIEEFERFLHARHAPEANRVMAERNPSQIELDAKRDAADKEVKRLRLQLQSSQAKGMSIVGIQKALAKAMIEADRWRGAEAFRGTEEERLSLSGMTDKEAASIMAGYTPERRVVMDGLAARVDRINAGTMKALEDYGLMDKATLDAWSKTPEHYVPLHRDEANPQSKAHPIGQGFSTKGDAGKRRTGSNEKVTNILGHIAMQREAALTRGEKNNVVKRLYLLASQNPDPELWSLDIPKKKAIDPETGLVRTMVDQAAKMRDNAVALRIGGKDQFIMFNERNESALRLAQAIKNLDAMELDKFTRGMGHLTRWFAAVNTQYNPVFGLMNITRDVQGVMLQLSSTPLAGKQGEVMKNIRANIGTIYTDLRRERNESGEPQGMWSKLWEQLQLDGGTTGYRDLYAAPADRAKALQKALDREDQGKVIGAARGVLNWLSDFNETLEGTTRLAVYKVALDRGLSREHAASIAKNITVNFNRKGRNTSVAGSYFAFLNAAIQGHARMLETLTGPAGRKIMIGGVAIGMMSALAGSLIMGGGGADDEWKKIPEFAKERSIIIPLGRQDYVAIPMPLGFHVFPNIGRKMVEFAMHDDPTASRGKYLADLAMTLVNAFSPIGGAENIWQMITPTPFDPVVAVGVNQDWNGREIYKEDQDKNKPTPGHARAKDSATPVSKWVARVINSATGGNEWQQGGWSPTPDALEYLFSQLTGGVGRELNKLGNMATSLATGEELAPHQMVLVGRLYGNTRGVNGQSASYYENIKRINSSYAEAKGRADLGENVDAVLEDVPLAKAHGAAALAQKDISDLIKRRRLIQSGDDPHKREKVKIFNEEIQRRMYQLNVAVENVIEERRRK